SVSMKPSPEVQQLITDTKKQLEHLRTLGVDGIRLQEGVRLEQGIHSNVTPTAPIPTPPKPTAQPRPTSTALFEDLPSSPQELTPSTETFEQIHAEIGDCTR